MVSIVLSHVNEFLDYAIFFNTILGVYYIIIFFSHGGNSSNSNNSNLNSKNSFDMSNLFSSSPKIPSSDNQLTNATTPTNSINSSKINSDPVSPSKSSHPNLNDKPISNREQKQLVRRKLLMNATKGFIIKSYQSADKLLNDISLNKNEVDLGLAKSFTKEINSNLRDARYELRKERKKEHGDKRKYVGHLQAYVEILLFNINQNIKESLPELDQPDLEWDKNIKKLKYLINKIKTGCGYLIKSIDKFIDESEHDVSKLNLSKSEQPVPVNNTPIGDNHLSDKFYTNAPSTKIFYNYPHSSDETGMLGVQEEHDRLFKRAPLFSTKQFYSMNDSILSLYKGYSSTADPMMVNYSQYLAEIETIVNNLEKFPKHCIAALMIPTYQEGQSVYNTLAKYASCSKSEQVAIFLLENHPLKNHRDNTIQEINRFRTDYPNITIYHIYKVFKERVPIGLIRKYLADVVLMLKFKSSHPGNLILIGGDADCVEIHKLFFSHIISLFIKNSRLDAIEMKLDFPKSYRLAFPNMWVMHRFFDFCWSYKRNKLTPNNAIRMCGPASAIKASSYLMIKGFNPRARLCEDLELSYMLDSGRRLSIPDPKNHFFEYSTRSITTNPRRALSSYISGMNLLTMYDGFEEKDEIRSLSWTDLVKKEGKGIIRVGNIWTSEQIRDYISNNIQLPSRDQKNDSGSFLSVFMQQSIDWWQYKVEFGHWMNLKQFEKMISRTMTFLGIEYTLDTSNKKWIFTILNADHCRDMMNVQLKTHHNNGEYLDLNMITIEKDSYKKIK